MNPPEVMHEALITCHEWGPYYWETDYRGTVILGAPPTRLQKALWTAPFAIGLVAVLVMFAIAEVSL